MSVEKVYEQRGLRYCKIKKQKLLIFVLGEYIADVY